MRGAATITLLVAAWLAAAALLWRTETPGLELPALDPVDYFPSAELDRIEEFRRGSRLIFAASLAAELSVLALVAWWARALAVALARTARGRLRTAVAFAVVASAAVAAATLPLAVTSHWWRRRYGLSRQGYPAWLGDWLTARGVRALLLALAVAGAVALAARFRTRWWVPGWFALAGAAVVFVLAQPLVVDPLFSRFRPLPAGGVARDVERVAARMGVDVETVEVADASRRTTAANAYVAGIGPTRRVVFFDTVLNGRFPRGELVALAAHELAHVRRRHLWKGLGWFCLLALPGLLLVARVTDRRGGLRDPALVPAGLLVAAAFALATLPLQNAVSRRYEAEADWLALQATRDPAAAIGLTRRLVRTNLSDPDPPPAIAFWLSTHPAPIDRIAMARAWELRTASRGGGRRALPR